MVGSDDDARAPTLVHRGPPSGQPASAELSPTTPVVRSDRAQEAVAGLVAGETIGRYRLIERLGEGAMGVVWSAQDPRLDRRVAIKVVHPSLARATDASDRLRREARAMAKLSHRAVVTVHDAGEVDGRLFLAMELVPGTTLGQLLRARSLPLVDWRRWLAMMLEAGHGLAAAHREGVLHRDFKPDNVLVHASGRVCVGDFGLASLGQGTLTVASERESGQPLDLTVTGALLGTPLYMSPQQLRGGLVDARADQFSFCVAAYEAVYGELPFDVPRHGINAIEVLAAAIESGARPEPTPGPAVPAPVRDVLLRGLSPDAGARWPDMDALLLALEHASSPRRRRADGQVEGTRSSRSRAPLYLGGAIGLAALGALIAVLASRENVPPGAAASPVVAARKLFAVAMRTTMGISPDGHRIALGSDRLEVRSLDDGETWVRPLDTRATDVNYIELGSSDVRFSLKEANQIQRWSYAGADLLTVDADIGGRWYGRTAMGDLSYSSVDDTARIVSNGHVERIRSFGSSLEVFAISPDGSRVAYLDEIRFDGRINVWDLGRDVVLTSQLLSAPTALAWLDAETLAYATGTQVQPTIYRARVDRDGFGPAEKIYGLDSGWFAELRARGKRLYVVEMQPTSRGRIIESTPGGQRARDFDHTSVSVPLGWSSATEFLAWNRGTRSVWRRTSTAIGTRTSIKLDGEPANATLAGDTLIVALRGARGRTAVAMRMDGTVQWRHADMKTLSVRCAGDRHPPCYAIRIGDRTDTVVAIDPANGALGRELYRGRADDIAIREDGRRILLCQQSNEVLELDSTGVLVETHITPLGATRSIAFYPDGGFAVAGTLLRNLYQVGRVRDGSYSMLVESDNDIVSLVRPSYDGQDVLMLGRLFEPEVWELTLR